ncbi:MAG: hypothetical protein RIQ62_1607, partial [Bacteroidota bacterium]
MKRAVPFFLRLSIVLFLIIPSSVKAQYCLPTYSIGCVQGDFIDNFSTTGGATNITNNSSGCNGSLPNSYTYNSAMTVTQVQGLSFNFSIQCGATWAQAFRIWVDWNHDFDFADPGEDVYVSPSSGTGAFTGTINVPATAVPGVTRMRALCRWITIPTLTDYCGTGLSFGECEDYNVNVVAATPCTGTPVAGTASALPANPCPGVSILLSTTGTSLAGGLAYQWQRANSPTAPAGAWVNIGITNPMTYLPPPGTTTFYRCIVTCTFTGLTSTSTVSGAVVVQPWSPTGSCWCVPTYANGGGGDNIINVSLGTLNNNTTAAGNPSPFWVDYTPQQVGATPALPTPNLYAGIPATLTISYGTDPAQYGAVWIDYNHSGSFDTSEYVSPGTNAGAGGIHTITLTPPGTSLPGVTRMRIRGGDDAQMNNNQPCGPTNSTWGETEDYLVNIIPAGPYDPALTNLTAPVGNLCPDSNQTLSATVCNYGSNTINLALNPVTVVYHVNGPSGLVNYTQVLNTGTLGSFGTGCQTSTVSPVNMFAGGNYLINATVSCPSLSNSFASNDSLTNAISITNYRPTAGPIYQLCQFSPIPFGQGLTVGGCSAPISDSIEITFNLTTCIDNVGAVSAGTGLGPGNANCNNEFAGNFGNAVIPALPTGAFFTQNAKLTITNLSSGYPTECRFNLYTGAPIGAGLLAGCQSGYPGPTGNQVLAGQSIGPGTGFTNYRQITTAQLGAIFNPSLTGSTLNIGYWESYNDLVTTSDIGVNAGGPTTAKLKVYYQYVPPSYSWYDVPTGGSSLYSQSPFNPFSYPNVVVNNSNNTGTYTFFAACSGLTSCRVPVKMNINPTPSACQDTLASCEYAVGANNAIFILDTTHSASNQVSCGNLAASVEYFGDQTLLSPIINVNNDTSSTNFIYSKVFYPSTGCYSSDSVYLDVHSIPQFSLPIYIGNACAPNAIDISSLINVFPTTNVDTLFFDDANHTIPYSGNVHAINTV